jgi:hypothetical protein
MRVPAAQSQAEQSRASADAAALSAFQVQMRADVLSPGADGSSKVRVTCGSCEQMCAGNAEHARCNMHQIKRTLRVPIRQRTLNKRRRSMYEASGCFAITSTSSAFSAAVPSTAICATCKQALLGSDGHGAAAVHSMYARHARPTVQRRLCARTPYGPKPYRQKRELWLVRACVRARTPGSRACAPQVQQAICNRQQATCNMQRMPRSIQTPAIPCVAGAARPMPRRAQCVAMRWVRRSYKVPSCNK